MDHLLIQELVKDGHRKDDDVKDELDNGNTSSWKTIGPGGRTRSPTKKELKAIEVAEVVEQEVAERKAARIYAVLDKYEWKNGEGVYGVVPEKGARSRMNVCFRVKGGDEAEEKRFVKEAEGRGLLGVKGHRSVGGIRVSNYNAVGEESVERLCGFLKEFAEGPKGA